MKTRALRLGAKAGAGLNWQVDKSTTLFGAHEATSAAQSGLTAAGEKVPAGAGIGGHDVTFGLRFRY